MGIPPTPPATLPSTIKGFLLACSLGVLEYDAWCNVDSEEDGESWWPVTTETGFVVERRGPVLEAELEADGNVASVRLTTKMRGVVAKTRVANMAVVKE